MSSHPDPAQDEFFQWFTRPPKRTLYSTFFRLGKVAPADVELFSFGRKVGAFDFKAKAELFLEYLSEATREPGYWKTADPHEGLSTGAHWAHAIIADLVAQCGYTQSEALNAPMGKCLHDYFRAAELDGSVRLKTREELELEEAAGV